MTQNLSKIPNFDAVLYKNENNTWFSSINRRVWPPGDHTRLKIWYNPCIIRQNIHGKTDENHVLFSNFKICTETRPSIVYRPYGSTWGVTYDLRTITKTSKNVDKPARKRDIPDYISVFCFVSPCLIIHPVRIEIIFRS